MDWLKKIPIGQYVSGKSSWLRGIDPRIKLSWILLFLLTPILANSLWRISIAFVLLLITFLSFLPPRIWWRSLVFLLAFSLVIGSLSIVLPASQSSFALPIRASDEIPGAIILTRSWEIFRLGPITMSGFINQGLKISYSMKAVTDRGAGAKPHQFFPKVPTQWPDDKKEGVFGVAPITEQYNLSRNSNDYGWGDWITSDWTDECGGSWIGNSKGVVCCASDCRCFFRMRYKATIVPSPTDTRFINANKGQISGAIYGQNASAVGVQPHVCKIAIEGQDTSGMFNSSFLPAAGDEYVVKIYRYGANVETQRVVADQTGKVIFAYAFPQEGLYQFTVDHVVSGNGCVVTHPNLNEYFDSVSPYHINFGLFVNPPPPKRGCTKVDDLNYDSSAQIDDGSCADFDYGFGGGDNNGGGGKGDVGGAISRYVDENMTATTGIAVAALAFLGIVAIGSFGSSGDE